VAGWPELTGLTKTLWRLRQPKPLSKVLGTRNTRHIASALERLRSAGLVKEAVIGNAHYLYLTERACGLPLLLGYGCTRSTHRRAPFTLSAFTAKRR